MSTYYKELSNHRDTENTLEILKALPDFCMEFYNGHILRFTPKTQFNYAFKFRVFLTFLHEYNPYFSKKSIKDITLDDLSLLCQDDIEDFQVWLRKKQNCPLKPSKPVEYNSASTIENYLAIVSSYYSYFVGKGKISRHPILGMVREKKKEKPLIYMAEDDKKDFIQTVRTGNGLSEKQKTFFDKNALRDQCIMILLLDTGIRVSELVGLDVDDIDFKHHKLKIMRKGNYENEVFFSDDTTYLLQEYLEVRDMYQPVDDENALFLVGIGKYKGQRLSVRSIETMVKKFAKAAGVSDFNNITPHKLRSTYAMSMLNATGDVTIVQQQLGHSKIDTTMHYLQRDSTVKELHRNDNHLLS